MTRSRQRVYLRKNRHFPRHRLGHAVGFSSTQQTVVYSDSLVRLHVTGRPRCTDHCESRRNPRRPRSWCNRCVRSRTTSNPSASRPERSARYHRSKNNFSLTDIRQTYAHLAPDSSSDQIHCALSNLASDPACMTWARRRWTIRRSCFGLSGSLSSTESTRKPTEIAAYEDTASNLPFQSNTMRQARQRRWILLQSG